ncbi:hypothetical protein Tco_1197171 [Tanacetum coccineum]
MRLGATKAHNLYSKMKGGTQYVHGTSDDFKNHIRDVNAFIGESDAQMLINNVGSQYFTQYKLERVRERDGWREYVRHTKESAATVRIPASICRIPKNLLDRVSQLRYPFSNQSVSK